MSAFTQIADVLPDGVWLNLESEPYFDQHALGSTDLIRLFKHKHGWWWSSRYNPDAKSKTSAEQTYGSALHAIILEGLRAYEARYAAEPDWPSDAIDTILQMRTRLQKEGYRLSAAPGQRPISDWEKSDWLIAMRQNLPRVPVISNLRSDWRRSTLGERTVISSAEDRMLRLMASVITDEGRADNAEIRKLFAGDGGYPALAEVSVFKTYPDGTRRRWRIDRMFPSFDLDLKSLGNWSGRPLKFSVGDMIAKYGYDIQRADYYEGREALYEHVAAGRIYGGTSEQRSWLRRFPQEFPTWAWVWLFYQKPDVAGRAPVLFPLWDDSWRRDPNNPYGPLIPSEIRSYGAAKAAKALRFYREAVAEFGLDQPWARVEPLHYADDVLEPNVSFPSWIAEDNPIDEAAYAV